MWNMLDQNASRGHQDPVSWSLLETPKEQHNQPTRTEQVYSYGPQGVPQGRTDARRGL